MKKLLIVLSLVLVGYSLWSAGLSLNFSPSSVVLNRMNTFSFDPVNPNSQPVLTQLTISNVAAPQYIEMQVQVKWNGNNILNPAAKYTSRELVSAPLALTNRDLITNESSVHFTGDNNIEVMDVVESYPTLKNAVMSGYFPDGDLSLEISIKPLNAAQWEDVKTFTITIRNAGSVYLSSPGVPVGQLPVEISQRPISFLWNAVSTGFNTQKLVIREYPPNAPPSLSNIENTGVVVYQTPDDDSASSGFAQFLPFAPGNFYAWQVYVPLYDEFKPYNPSSKTNARITKLESGWYVFKFVAEEEGNTGSNSSDVQQMLNLLGNSALQNLFNMGYTPTGDIIYDGRTYSGQAAVELLSILIGRNITIRVLD